MSSIRNRLRFGLTPDDLDTWVKVNPLALPPDTRMIFEKRQEAVIKYVSGTPLSELSLSRFEIFRLVKRCLQPHPDGGVFGYRALVFGTHVKIARLIKPTILTSDVPAPGSLQALFRRFPAIYKTMFDLVVHGKRPGSRRHSERLSWAVIHEYFLSECENANIRAPSYPFNSESSGLPALRRWAKSVKSEEARRAELVRLDAISGSSDLSLRIAPSRCFEQVECDGHFVDLDWVIETKGLSGEGVIRILVSRLWLIPLLECVSGAVIGYSVAFGSNYSASDVARALHSAIVPWKPRKLSISTLSYGSGECLPNALCSELAFVCFDELWLDNAKSHLSELFLGVCERTVAAVPVFGPVAAPNVRPRIEGVFDLLEEAGIRPLDGAIPPKSGHNKKKKRTSTRYHLTLEAVLDFIDLLIVRYNASTAPGTNISHLEVLRRAVIREASVFRYIPEELRETCLKYDIFEISRIGIDHDKTVLRWRNARYFGKGLYQRSNLVGQEVLVLANSLDLRVIEICLLVDGTSLGSLEVEKRWRTTAHGLISRQEVRKAMTHNSFVRNAADLPKAMLEHVEAEARKSARAARRFARMFLEQQHGLYGDSNPAGDLSIENGAGFDAQTSVVVLSPEEDEQISSFLSKAGAIYR